MTAVTSNTLRFLEDREGLSLKAYPDSRGIWTIGYGMTRLNGRAVLPGDVITEAEANRLFFQTVQFFQNHVLSLVEPAIAAKLKPQQITALVSLAYNIGLGGFKTSTALKKLNAGDYQGAADAFLNWTRAGDNRHALLPRRKLERSLFLS